MSKRPDVEGAGRGGRKRSYLVGFGIDDEPRSVVAESTFVKVSLLHGGAATRLDGVNKEALDTELFRPEIEASFVSHKSCSLEEGTSPLC